MPFLEPSGLPDAVWDAGGEPVPLRLPPDLPRGMALAREWVCDAAQMLLPPRLDALLLDAHDPPALAGLVACGLRRDLPAVVAAGETPLHTALVAAGAGTASAPPEAARAVVRAAEDGGPRPQGLLENFALANALRAGVAAGGGAPLLVHLAALAREADVAGFSQMVRVLAPETPVLPQPWVREHGAPGVLSRLGDLLHAVPAVARGTMTLEAPEPAPPDRRLGFIRGRNSGTEAVCSLPAGTTEVAGECRVFGSEREAARAVRDGSAGEGGILVVPGCGARGGPGVLPLDDLAAALPEAGETVVLTDGVAPEGAGGVWISAFYPEAVVGGILGRLRDGDRLEIDLEEGRIRAGVRVDEILARTPPEPAPVAARGYAARYARAALPALEGGGLP